MKYLPLLIGLFSTALQAQTILNFDKRFVECEDKWVAFQAGKDSSHVYGFIYIDAQAGLTLNYEGTFTISADNKFVPAAKSNNGIYKVRLQANNVRVAIIPGAKFNELQIDEYPNWLKTYKGDTSSVERLYRWGFLYNSWDECAKALTYLERAQRINPQFKGLEFELAFAYNALGQFNKAITVLEDAVKTNPADCSLYKELSFAEMHLGQLEKASATCKKGISVCSDKQMKSEIAYNMTYQYYKLKDKDNFSYWADETKKWATTGDRIMNSINKMETDLMK